MSAPLRWTAILCKPFLLAEHSGMATSCTQPGTRPQRGFDDGRPCSGAIYRHDGVVTTIFRESAGRLCLYARRVLWAACPSLATLDLAFREFGSTERTSAHGAPHSGAICINAIHGTRLSISKMHSLAPDRARQSCRLL